MGLLCSCLWFDAVGYRRFSRALVELQVSFVLYLTKQVFDTSSWVCSYYSSEFGVFYAILFIVTYEFLSVHRPIVHLSFYGLPFFLYIHINIQKFLRWYSVFYYINKKVTKRYFERGKRIGTYNVIQYHYFWKYKTSHTYKSESGKW